MNRRDFLKYSAFGVATAMWPFAARADNTPRWEGIYTDRFTYRAGVDRLNIHISLLDVTSVDLLIIHRDHLPTIDLVFDAAVAVDNTQVPEYPGVPSGGAGIFGPQFPVRLSLNTKRWEPGFYSVQIPPEAMRPGNRTNVSGSQGLISQNHIAYFVVTAAVMGSHASILWVHDSATGTAYGGFGGESIYGNNGTPEGVYTVSTRRPGLDRGIDLPYWDVVLKLKNDGYRFEYIDALQLGLHIGPLPYELIVVSGQFEYLSQGFLANLKAYSEAGGNLLIAAHEFAVYRTRVDSGATSMTTYKNDAALDPISGAEQAGVGMLNPAGIYETEIAGMNTFTGWDNGHVDQDLSITNADGLGWLFEGTGFSNVLPGFINGFCNGSRGVLSGNVFTLLDTQISRTPAGTVVWAAAPMPGALKWDAAVLGQDQSVWPIDPNGHATCTFRETNGSRVMGLPQSRLLDEFFDVPGYDRMVENILAYLAPNARSPEQFVPLLSPLGAGVLSAALFTAARASTQKIRSEQEQTRKS